MNDRRTVALIYHDLAAPDAVDAVGFPGAAAARYKLTPEAFAGHLDAIARTGVRVGLVHDRAQAALTFDDGGASAIQAADLLEARGWRGHFFITTGRIGSAGFLDREQVAELARRGHDVGSHSHSHPTYMGTLSHGELAAEWRRSAEVLADITGSRPLHAAVPGGFVSDAVIAEASAAGYRMLMTSRPTAGARIVDGMEVRGRFTIWEATSPQRAAAYARGDPLARLGMWAANELKTAPKRLSPRAYEAARQAWARFRHP
ncbi:MAG TPA: polysaccharide deacetylase family protein [Solirubrobacteraceae bacterium]|jgi:peptidoglycan/xylan/chitin deacetylase (PgdA/CDA1 family)